MTQSHTRCTYCRARKDNSAFAQQGDHVIPASIGGDWVDPQICATCEATSNRVADQLIATDPLVVFLRNAYQIPDRRYGEVPDACRFSVRVRKAESYESPSATQASSWNRRWRR